MASAHKTFNALFSNLAPRQKEVILGRFGLDKSKGPETLAAIGKRMGITRERVRQIEKSALEHVGKEIPKDAACAQSLNKNKRQLAASGGVMKKEALLKYGADVMDGLGENHLALLLEASGAFNFHAEDENYWPFYYLTKDDAKTAANFIDGWASLLRDKKQRVLEGAYKSHLEDYIKAKKVNRTFAENCLAITKKIGSNPYGDMGLNNWPEINPATTRDKIYLVLKKGGQPLHFETIADTINKTGFSAQTALAPTVHNELIKDSRFVLVGRGLYALKEHGYEPGIAREVIQRILKKRGPLHAKEVVELTNKERLFKPNTIIINLQNKTFFDKLADGRYRVRES